MLNGNILETIGTASRCTLNIQFEQKLKDYMARKHYALRLETIDPVGCCADTSELCIGFVHARDVEAVREKALREIECPDGTLFVMTRGLEYDEDIVLSLHSFLGAKDVRAQGIRVWRF